MFWSINEANPVGRVAEVGLPADHALKNPLLALDTQIRIISDHASDKADQRFTLVSVELIAQENEMGLGVRLDEVFNMPGKVGFRSRIRNGGANQFTRGQMQVACENLGSVPDVIELPTLNTICFHRQGLAIPLQRLDTGFLVDTDHVRTLIVLVLSLRMQFTDFRRLLDEYLPVVNVRVFPIAASMRLKQGSLLKNGSHAPARSLGQSPLRSLPLSTFPLSNG